MPSVRSRYRQRSCKWKWKYPNEGQALVAIARVSNEGHIGLMPYKCEFCDSYHIGHPPQAGGVYEVAICHAK